MKATSNFLNRPLRSEAEYRRAKGLDLISPMDPPPLPIDDIDERWTIGRLLIAGLFVVGWLALLGVAAFVLGQWAFEALDFEAMRAGR